MIPLPTPTKPQSEPAPRWFHIAVAVSMVLSAGSALVAALHNGRTMTALVEQNARIVRANSTPLLEFGHGNRSDDAQSALIFTVRNLGRGPARIVWFELKVDGKPHPNMRSLLATLGPSPAPSMTFSSGAIAPRILGPDGSQIVFNWPEPAKTDAANAIWHNLNAARFKTMEVQACYCSLFEECWTSRLRGDVPLQVPECKPEGHVILQG